MAATNRPLVFPPRGLRGFASLRIAAPRGGLSCIRSRRRADDRPGSTERSTCSGSGDRRGWQRIPAHPRLSPPSASSTRSSRTWRTTQPLSCARSRREQPTSPRRLATQPGRWPKVWRTRQRRQVDGCRRRAASWPPTCGARRQSQSQGPATRRWSQSNRRPRKRRQACRRAEPVTNWMADAYRRATTRPSARRNGIPATPRQARRRATEAGDLPLAADEVAPDRRALGVGQVAGVLDEEGPRQSRGDVGVVHQPEVVLERGRPGRSAASASAPSASRTNSSV